MEHHENPNRLWGPGEPMERLIGRLDEKIKDFHEDLRDLKDGQEKIKKALSADLKDHSERIRALEQWRAKTSGALMVVGAGIGAGISWVFGLFEKLWKHS